MVYIIFQITDRKHHVGLFIEKGKELLQLTRDEKERAQLFLLSVLSSNKEKNQLISIGQQCTTPSTDNLKKMHFKIKAKTVNLVNTLYQIIMFVYSFGKIKFSPFSHYYITTWFVSPNIQYSCEMSHGNLQETLFDSESC